ncbi:Protein of unknown function [Pyronema omphalodes CBS 100304]|uniref:Uncharacterized protein n=1 Tax=Pyronema omphalodes (strain CBS 100304) TaxID=1076935 RepID=U4LR05_PYROM|nr:Protein of unknown function [Pyronema omphalodes CBS 100304]
MEPSGMAELISDLMLVGMEDIEHNREAISYLWPFAESDSVFVGGSMLEYSRSFDRAGAVIGVVHSWRSTQQQKERLLQFIKGHWREGCNDDIIGHVGSGYGKLTKLNTVARKTAGSRWIVARIAMNVAVLERRRKEGNMTKRRKGKKGTDHTPEAIRGHHATCRR